MTLGLPRDFTMLELDLSDDHLASQVHGVMLRSYQIEAGLIGSDAIPGLHETRDQMRSRPLRWIGALSPDQSLVAFVAWKMLNSAPGAQTLDLDRVCVDPQWFRRGLASALIRHLLDHTTAPLITVSTGESNTPAVALYEGLGFSRSGSSEPVPGLRLAKFITHTTE